MYLSIKKVPKTYWRSSRPFNFKPNFSTLFFLCFGLSLFGLGEGLLIVSFTGASPWSVLAQGISLNIDFSIGPIPKANNKVPIPTVPPKYHPTATTDISRNALTAAMGKFVFF